MKEVSIKKFVVGVVTKNKMDKSIIVEVIRRIKHPQFKKFISRKERVMAHDPKNVCGVGDKVKICECRPLSKRKKWRLTEVVEKAG